MKTLIDLTLIPSVVAYAVLADYGLWATILAWLLFWGSLCLRDALRDKYRKPHVVVLHDPRGILRRPT